MHSEVKSEHEVLEYLKNGTLVGLLPVPHPILIRKYQTSENTEQWFHTYIWGVVYVRWVNNFTITFVAVMITVLDYNESTTLWVCIYNNYYIIAEMQYLKAKCSCYVWDQDQCHDCSNITVSLEFVHVIGIMTPLSGMTPP